MKKFECGSVIRVGGLAILLATTAACGFRGTGAILPSGGFSNSVYPLQVGYGNYPVHGEILGPDWRLDNFRYEDGAATVPKVSPEYVEEIRYDENDDGIEEGRRPWSSYDLRFVNRKTRARILLWSIPLSGHDRDVEARVLARDFADAFGVQSRAVSGSIADGRLSILTFGRTVTSSIQQEATCQLGDQAAHQIDLELADVDQIKLDPDKRFRRVRLVVSRTSLAFQVKTGLKVSAEYPVILVAALTSRPEDFEVHLRDFDKLMGEVGIGVGAEGPPPSTPSGFKCKAIEAQAPKSEPELPASEPAPASPPVLPEETPPVPSEQTPPTPSEVPAPEGRLPRPQAVAT